MKNLKSKKLMAYALSFVSFALPKIDVDEIILFGSVARGDFEKESDVDLFFDINDEKKEKKTKEILKKELERFYKSKIFETWRLKGINNSINFEVGILDKWKLKRSIISDGVVLFGGYKGIPERKKGFVYFAIKPVQDITRRNRVLRYLFGRKEKNYSKEGIVELFKGKKISSASFVIPIGRTEEIIKFLNSEKVDYNFFEFWTDQIYV